MRPTIERSLDQEPAGTELAHRLFVGLAGGVYAGFLILTYVQLSKLWAYMGFWYNPPPADVTIISIIASGLLALLLPIRGWSVVGFAKWVLCYLLFIPGVVIPWQQGILETSDLRLLTALVWISSAIFILLLRDGAPIPGIRLSERTLWNGVLIAWGLGHVAVVWVFRDSMNLAGIEQVYDQRAAAGSVAGAAIGYVMGFLSGAINPFLLVIGLARRRPLLIALALIGQVIIYSTLAGKVVLGSTFLTIGTYFAFKHGKVIFTRVYAAILSFGIMGPIIAAPRATGTLVSDLSDLIYMRILVLPGVLVGAYNDFFLRYPVTYLSHSLVGRAFSTYPYGDESVGQVIGRYVTPSSNAATNNYNANFIAADGIAGFGTWGVPLIFLVVAGWLWFASKMVGPEERPIVCAALTPFIVSLADASFFTSLLTGGGTLAVLLLYLYRSARGTAASDRGASATALDFPASRS